MLTKQVEVLRKLSEGGTLSVFGGSTPLATYWGPRGSACSLGVHLRIVHLLVRKKWVTRTHHDWLENVYVLSDAGREALAKMVQAESTPVLAKSLSPES